MSKKDKAVGAEAHMNSAARVLDGWVYEVTLQNGTTLEFWDRDYLGSVIARWNSTEPNALISFSGAKADVEGFVVGAGAVRASLVVAIAEGNPEGEDEESDEDDQGEESEEDLEDQAEELRGQFRPVAPSEPAAAPPSPAPAAPVVTDAELD